MCVKQNKLFSLDLILNDGTHTVHVYSTQYTQYTQYIQYTQYTQYIQYIQCPSHTYSTHGTFTCGIVTLLTSLIQGLIPFAVLGSDRSHTVNGKQVLGRQTKWGLVEVENKKHCDFSYLRDMLIRWA